jgi:hypothetical protein
MTRARTYLYTLIIACGAACGPASSVASADHGTPYESATLTRYLHIAEAQWGAPAPTCAGRGNSVVRVHAVLFDSPDPGVSAVAELPGCRIWLDRDFWPAADSAIDCIIIAHEWGHLLGYGHSQVEQSLMFATPEHGVPGCGTFGRFVAPAAAPRRCAGRPKAARSRGRQARGRCTRLARGRSVRQR